MKKTIIVCFVFVLAMTFAATNSFAQPSAKATAQCGNVSVVPLTENGNGSWTEIFSQVIKTPTGKDLFIDVSLECGLTTNTKVMSKMLEKALANAEAIVKVQVKVDGNPVMVNGSGDSAIVFARRQQTLIAEFAGLYDLWDPECVQVEYACVGGTGETCEGGTQVVTGITFSDDPECFDPESLQLILDTMTANSFNFIAPDLVAGEHTVSVEAKLEYDADYEINDQFVEPADVTFSAASAYLGNGSVTIETVRMIKDENVIVDLE